MREPARGADLFLRRGRLWPGTELVDISVRDGVIEGLGAAGEARLRPTQDATVIDAAGLSVIPGLVDVHVHFRDPGLAWKEGWERGSAGALHGGVTSVVEVQNNPPLSTDLGALTERIEHVRASSRVDYGCLANLLPDSLEHLLAMAPTTPAFKCFLGGSTGMAGQGDRVVLRELFAGAARAGRMIVAHCEDEALLKAGAAAHPHATVSEHHLVRSSEAEVESVRMALELAEETGVELHVFHVSTAAAADLIRTARTAGQTVSASTAPHYVLLSCADAPGLGNRIKVNPSVKTPQDAAGVLAALADGTIDAIGTDHAPHPFEHKDRPYAKAPSGMPSIDLLWPLTLELVRRGLLDAETALTSVTERAAESLHLPGKGRLEAGCDGDLVLFDPDEKRTVEGANLPSTSKWSAYEGWSLAGFPRTVVRRGEVVFDAGQVTGQAGGQPLRLPCPKPVGQDAARSG